MSDATTLTIAFLERAPKAAAQELQRLPVEDSAALIDSVPTRYGTVVLNAMIPWHAARILELLAASKAAAVLRHLSFADGISIMRLVNSDNRDPIIEALPTRYARRLRGALTYAEYQVGAWTDPDVPTLAVEDSVADAVRVIKEADSASHVFLESEGHEKFVGMISIREILRGEQSTKLGQLNVVRAAPISNRASLSSLAFDERWDDFLHLPVVGRRGNLLGGLSRRTLRHAAHAHFSSGSEARRSPFLELLIVFAATCAGLLKLRYPNVAAGHPSGEGGVSDER